MTWPLPFPAGTIGVPPNVRGDIQALADAINAYVWPDVNGAKLETTDSGWSLALVTLASGWGTKTDPQGNTSGTVYGGVRKVGQRVEVRVRATRTGGTITPGATGNFADTSILTLASGYHPASNVYGDFVLPGSTGGICRVGSDGLVQLTNAFNAASTISNGDVIQIQTDFFVN